MTEPLTDDVRLDRNVAFDQTTPAVAGLASGGFASIWRDTDQDPGFDGSPGV